jgi:hypothetical protein
VRFAEITGKLSAVVTMNVTGEDFWTSEPGCSNVTLQTGSGFAGHPRFSFVGLAKIA